MKIKTSELTGAALDWAVAKCEGYTEHSYMRNAHIVRDVNGKVTGIQVPTNRQYIWYSPSTDWSQGGPIIERELINVVWLSISNCCASLSTPKVAIRACGPTPLISAMRCYVASKLGDEVEVPDGLV
jgi:hypothetical protein